jgi:hypothetical protein
VLEGGVPEGFEFVPGLGLGLFGVFGDVVVPVPGFVGVLGEPGAVVVPGVAVLAPGVAVLAGGVAVLAPGVAVDGELDVPGVAVP